MTNRTLPTRKLDIVLVGLFIAFACLVASIDSPASQSKLLDGLDHEVRSEYESLSAKGEETVAVQLLLAHAEKAYGENAPKTVRLTHAYGYLLLQDGSYRKAVKVLKKALKRLGWEEQILDYRTLELICWFLEDENVVEIYKPAAH